MCCSLQGLFITPEEMFELKSGLEAGLAALQLEGALFSPQCCPVRVAVLPARGHGSALPCSAGLGLGAADDWVWGLLYPVCPHIRQPGGRVFIALGGVSIALGGVAIALGAIAVVSRVPARGPHFGVMVAVKVAPLAPLSPCGVWP